MLEILGPNFRPVQVTDDLAGVEGADVMSTTVWIGKEGNSREPKYA